MTRIAKEPLERRNEIIDTAEQFFNARGYEQTTVSDIVKQVGVAQGLFYYYFKSKEEVLEAIAERYATQFINTLSAIAANPSLNPPAKLREILDSVFKLAKGNEGVVTTIHQASYEPIHEKVAISIINKLVPVFTEIVQEGIEQGCFLIRDAAVTVEVVFLGLERYLNRKIRECFGTPEFETYVQRAIAVLEQALGAPNGSLQL